MFTIYNGLYEKITVKQLCGLLNINEEEAIDFITKSVSKVLKCILEMSEVFVGNSYTKSYIHYFEDESLVNYDYLFVRIAACLDKSIVGNICYSLFYEDQ